MRVPTLHLRARLHRIARFWRTSELTRGIVLIILVGLASGMGAVIFRWMISGFQTGFFEGGATALSFLGRYYVVVLPALGGLLVGVLVYFFAREAKGHGVPEVMLAVAAAGGRIPVVARDDPSRLLGVLRRHDIVRAYTKAVAGEQGR